MTNYVSIFELFKTRIILVLSALDFMKDMQFLGWKHVYACLISKEWFEQNMRRRAESTINLRVNGRQKHN